MGFKRAGSISEFKMPRLSKDPGKDISAVVENLNRYLKEMATVHNENLLRLERSLGSGGATVIYSQAGSGGAVIASGIIATAHQSVNAGNNTITFGKALKAVPDEVMTFLYDENNVLVEWGFTWATAKTATGFEYNSPATATLFYIAMVSS